MISFIITDSDARKKHAFRMKTDAQRQTKHQKMENHVSLRIKSQDPNEEKLQTKGKG